MGRWIGAVMVATSMVASPAPTRADDPVVDLTPHIDDDRWCLFAVEYARSRDVSVRRLVVGAAPSERVDMSWYFLVAVGHGRVVLIDAGTDAFARRGRARLRDRWSIAEARTVVEALGRVGLEPSEVTDVILTHFHWDHSGGVTEFSRARVHALAPEWRRVPSRVRRAVEREGRFHEVAANGVVAPGISVSRGGRHTEHHAMVSVACADREVIVASDAAYLYRNMERRRPVTVTTDAEANVADVAAAVARVGVDDVVPGHDPALFSRFSTDDPTVAAICR